MQEVQAVIEYSLDLQDLAENPDLPKGLGKVTIYGGRIEAENRTRELRDIFRCCHMMLHSKEQVLNLLRQKAFACLACLLSILPST